MYTPLLSLSSVYFCLHSFYLAASSANRCLCAWLFTPVLTWPVLYLCAIYLFIFYCFVSLARRVQLQWEVRNLRLRYGAVPQHWQWGALCELQRQHRWAPL